MKQGKKVVIVCVFVLAGLLSLIGMTTNAGGVVQENHTVGRQVVLRLIDHFADPECAEAVGNSQPKSTTFEQPVPECWLVSEARTVLGNHGRSEE